MGRPSRPTTRSSPYFSAALSPVTSGMLFRTVAVGPAKTAILGLGPVGWAGVRRTGIAASLR